MQKVIISLQLYGDNGLANHAAACAYGFLLSMAPMLFLIAFFIFIVFKPSPAAITALISQIPFIGGIFEEQWLSSDFFSFVAPGISGIIFVLSIIWAGRILADSMQRGLKIIFPAEKSRNPVNVTLVTFAIEASVIIFVLAAIGSSRTAVTLYRFLHFFPENSFLKFFTSYTGGRLFYIILLGFGVFLAYIFVPVKSPRRFSAFQGALLCTFSYFCTVVALGIIMNYAKFNLLYGTLGNMIILLINVYFFFNFFFMGAQFAYVIDSFDALLFSKLWLNRHRNLLSKFYYPAGGKLDKYLRRFKKNDIVIAQGDTTDGIFYILEGQVEVLLAASRSEDGSFTGISAGVLETGSFFGEMGYLLSEGRTATVMAKTDISVFALPLSLFDDILKCDTNIDKFLIEEISRRLKDRNEQIVNLSRPDN
jgi:membrane protein